MEDFQASLIITLLTWTAVSVSGTTPELSTTTGDTVNIPCLFGEGTLRYILWSYNNSTGRQNILMFTDGDFTIEADYANRASLQDDYSTLILKEITVADEGIYHCLVDTLKQTAAVKINTKLNVFSLRPDTLPVISPCTWADDASYCSIHRKQSFTLTCTLPNVYPVEDTELIWYKNRKHFSSIHDVMQNDDGTTDISEQIQVSETGNFTCNATYVSANGRENTAVAVEASITLPADIRYIPGKNMTSGPIAWKTIRIVLFVCIPMAIIAFVLYHLKARGQRSFRDDELKQVTSAEHLALVEISTEYGINDENVDRAASRLSSNRGPSPNARRHNMKRVMINNQNVSQEQLNKISREFPNANFESFSKILGVGANQANSILMKHSKDYRKALMDILMAWKNMTGGPCSELEAALSASGAEDLIADILYR